MRLSRLTRPGVLERLGNRLQRYRMRAAERNSVTTGEYWEQRARLLGQRAVLNASHSESEMRDVTARQKNELYPVFRDSLSGSEQIVLDFGCGTGRFTPDLARIVGGKAIGVDPTASLLHLAPRSDDVEYRRMNEGLIPVEDRSIDAIWIVLVLGAITEPPALRGTIAEIDRVLKPGGLVLVAENTSSKADGPYWAYRSLDEYTTMFAGYSLVPRGQYVDLDDRISILVGRKPGMSLLAKEQAAPPRV